MSNQRSCSHRAPLSTEQRQRLITRAAIDAHCDESDWARLESFVYDFHACKTARWHEGTVLSRDKMLQLASLLATCRDMVHNLANKELDVLFSVKSLLSDERTEFTKQEIDRTARNSARGFLIECNKMEDAALRAACNFHDMRRPHNVDMAQYELWAFAGKFFYEPVSSRKMATSRGEEDGSYGGHVGGPFVRFIQALMMIVDGSEPTGDDVRTFVRHFRKDEVRGQSIVALWTIEDGRMVLAARNKKIKLVA